MTRPRSDKHEYADRSWVGTDEAAERRWGGWALPCHLDRPGFFLGGSPNGQSMDVEAAEEEVPRKERDQRLPAL